MPPFTGEQLAGKQYSSLIYTLAQQQDMRFANNVRVETVAKAEEAYWHRIAPWGEPAKKTERYGITPSNEAQFSRRRVVPEEWHDGARLDKHDVVRYATIDPQNDIVKALVYSFNRKKDSLVIGSAFGSAATGKSGEIPVLFKDETISINGDGTATTMGTLAVDTGTITAISLAKIATMLELFNNDDVDPVIPKYWGFTPKDSSDMLSIMQLTSRDYIPAAQAIEEGKVKYALGFNFFWSNLIPKTTTGDEYGSVGTSLCYRNLVWAKDGIILAYIGDMNTTIDRLPEHQNNTQIYSTMDLGAVRFEGAKVRECLTKVSHAA